MMALMARFPPVEMARLKLEPAASHGLENAFSLEHKAGNADMMEFLTRIIILKKQKKRKLMHNHIPQFMSLKMQRTHLQIASIAVFK